MSKTKKLFKLNVMFTEFTVIKNNSMFNSNINLHLEIVNNTNFSNLILRFDVANNVTRFHFANFVKYVLVFVKKVSI